MGSHMNFKNVGDAQPLEGNTGSGRPPGNLPLARQPSIFSLTLDEVQNTMGGLGKDFGSMNMDEFLKNIWTAEEAQAMASTFGGTEGGVPGTNLQRQGSLTLPRTLSQKTVDEVWRDIFKESASGKDGSGSGGSNLQSRQQTLGEMTLEEFLVKAGVVREDIQTGTPNNSGMYVETRSNDNIGLALGFPQPGQTNGVVLNRIAESNNPVHTQSPNLAININGARSSQPQQQQQLPQLFAKQSTVAFASAMHLANTNQLSNPGMRGGVADPMLNNGFGQGGGPQSGGMGMVGLGAGAVTVATGSPANQLSSDGLGKSNGDTSSLSPVPYPFNSLRGRRCSGAVEKVVERRQRRMIKNRESAARSRARKQAYTMELEAEVAKLKEENQELQKRQAEIMEMQKYQDETMNQQNGNKKRCLRRTQTGPW
ncbi:PREDICTED: ABSCISIC ACID-INSENSITIVE 5-like protein 5 isoform X1 [Nelumbo nucifera]|uniref:ABSCISIC ACID-INSENSITIVE 5-like protein 5 isoform X1 n=1 Tax=Nelumbo nucifera TaxID=4432 RepID=A0A1U8APC8_NELNU|nr:PREDICTED: ABSCISIC ACID-INSENSITIVE 5-like protein 5 isoform X1 [Nelumbo nucifera]XP_010269652.1 PREDICTED: ABSCISIC ACID-INSENSITIVE 5-like protein 5 isoform X1 [Nelumbo nucifera]XP_010269660.1 PREDICTED: ABSCISIC ACID-INSENSITIVE 5-like protein 5 isoform X1 [Nelumbo nucifera]XP_019054745.1 PREDICTED: ABSCISIC ACID-INSENSITIVE 5-like protein 5 isoform X1 [Nelumbo nucifera]